VIVDNATSAVTRNAFLTGLKSFSESRCAAAS
jgi:hypothetical protein